MKKVLSNERFKEVLSKGVVTEELEAYLKHQQQLNEYQFYLNDGSFAIFQEYRKICRDLEQLDSGILNAAQKRTIEFYKQTLNVQAFSINSYQSDEGGSAYKYTNPHGFIAISSILIATFATGITIALVLLSKIS